MPENSIKFPHVKVLDVGCGYGGLLYNMSQLLDSQSLALGMEIRDKVSVFVSDKIKTLRINSEHKEVNSLLTF